MFSLPIVTKSPSGNYVVDLTPVFMSDLPQISAVLQGFGFAADRSSWAEIKGFKDNVEIEVAATYASSGGTNGHRCRRPRRHALHPLFFSRLPETGYQPRLADDRVGYFLTVIKDFSKTGQEDQFVRYVNRWDLRKVEPSAKVSPPAKPIIFWIEKTVPYKFRGAVREGILEWNKAFERAGFSNAIEVRQQPDDATWDPEDINYNTFRWITERGLCDGPQPRQSDDRPNPRRRHHFRRRFHRTMDADDRGPRRHRHGRSALPGAGIRRELRGASLSCGPTTDAVCDYSAGWPSSWPSASMAHEPPAARRSARRKSKSCSSTASSRSSPTRSATRSACGTTSRPARYLTMDEINDPEKTRDIGLAASVMDYVPVNISPKGKKQGDYFSRTIGPYDYWAIEYAYKPLPGGTDGEKAELAKIASRGTEPALHYATDEDIARLDARSAGEPLRPEQRSDRVRPLARRIDQPVAAGPDRRDRRAGRRLSAGPAWRSRL